MATRLRWAMGSLCSLVALACSSAEDGTGSRNNGGQGNGGSGTGAAGGVIGSGTGAAGGASGAGAAGGVGGAGAAGGVGGAGAAGGVGGAGAAGGTSGAAGVGAGGSGGDTGGSAGSGGSTAGTAGVGGTAGAGGSAGNGLGVCESGAITPCGSFKHRLGHTIPLGPYGAIMDKNQGQGFEIPIHPSDNLASCTAFGALFGEDPTVTAELMDMKDNSLALYTVYRPALPKEGEKYPVITWGNGTCAQPEGYGALLRYVASYGYIVVAANSRYVGQAPSAGAMTKALDFITAANGQANSPVYQRADMTKVGAMGHSQGGGATTTAARDSRVQAVIIFNAGPSATKPFLAISADMDLAGGIGTFQSAVNGAAKAAYLWYKNPKGTGSLRGHLTLMMEPERLVEPTVGWFNLLFRNDAAARTLFVGTSCGLCNKATDFQFGQKGL